jgi:glycine cleavage system H protein
MSPSKKHHIVPPGELCCVWMTAGILSYQLCDREFECDDCPLDAAMRKHFTRRTASVEAAPRQPAPAAAPQVLRDNCRYNRNHCWIQQVGRNVLRVGPEPGLSRALLAPRAVVYPTKGQMLHRGQTCMWIVMEGGTLPFESPCDGVVRSTNRQLTEQPHLIQSRPFDEGWLLELQVEDAASQTADFLDAEEVRASYTASESRFRELLESALRKGQPSVGATLADGGQLLQNIADVLGPSRYFSIVRRVYST